MLQKLAVTLQKSPLMLTDYQFHNIQEMSMYQKIYQEIQTKLPQRLLIWSNYALCYSLPY